MSGIYSVWGGGTGRRRRPSRIHESAREPLHSRREWVHPFDLFRTLGVNPDTLPPWITFDPETATQYVIRRGSTHDGTHMFTYELIRDLLEGVASRTAMCNSDPWSDEDWPHVRYALGWVRHAITFGRYRLPCGLYPAQQEVFNMPVRVIVDRPNSEPDAPGTLPS